MADEQKELDAQLALLTSKKKLLDIQHQLEEAQKPPDQTLQESAARKARLDAQKGVLDAETSLVKAQFPVPDRQATEGTVSLNDKAGIVEAHLLATKALKEASDRIAGAMKKIRPDKTILLFQADQVPTFRALIASRIQIELAQRAIADALLMPPHRIEVEVAAVGPMTGFVAAGTILDSVTRLLSFFKTDFAVSGFVVAMPDSVMVATMGHSLLAAGRKLRTPALFSPELADPSKLAGTQFVQKLSSLTNSRFDAAQELQTLVGEIQVLDAQIAAASVPNPADLKTREEMSKKRDAIQAAMGIADALFAKLGAADDTGRTQLGQMVVEALIAETIKDCLVLSLRIDKSGGGALTKKNLWTMLGTMPLFHMGGIAVSYLLWSGDSGVLLASGAETVYGGFVKSGDLRAELER